MSALPALSRLLPAALLVAACTGDVTPSPSESPTATQAGPTATSPGGSPTATSPGGSPTATPDTSTVTPTAPATPTAAPATPTQTPGTPPPPLTCSLTYDLPADLSKTVGTGGAGDASQIDLDELSWRSFLALNAPTVGGQPSTGGDNVPQWAAWSSSVDLIECQQGGGIDCVCPSGDCSNSGSRYYPGECQGVADFMNYRVLDQVGKVDDDFFEARTGGLSVAPVIDSEGRFLRYEILVSPATYTWISAEGLTDPTTLQSKLPINFPCGDASYTGGDPANSQMGGMVVKAAWMELGGRSASDYHTEDILVYTPADRNKTGVATCEKKTLALVGLHVAHKTLKQPNWTWSTFEHEANAPDCKSLPPEGQQGGEPSTDCPTPPATDYNFYPADCSGDRCQTCNKAPAPSATDDTCGGASDPGDPTPAPWCVDVVPRNNPWPTGATYSVPSGLSRLCRQVPVATYYPTADRWNQACAAALGGASVWSRYQLISTQWFVKDFSDSGIYTCQNVDGTVVPSSNRHLLSPQVPISAIPQPTPTPPGVAEVDTRPYLANTSMESYERSACMACHAKSQFDGGASRSTDFIYFLRLEVGTPTPAP